MAHNFRTNTEISSSPTDLVFLKFRMIPMTSVSFTEVNSKESSTGLTYSLGRGASGTFSARLFPTSAKKKC